MKKDIHPTYQKAKVTCACGNKFETKSTIPEIHVELCSACHPFFTGKQKLVDTAGRVDKFEAKRKKAAALKAGIKVATDKNTDRKGSRIDTDKPIKSEKARTDGKLEKIITHGVPEEKIENIEKEFEKETVEITEESNHTKA